MSTEIDTGVAAPEDIEVPSREEMLKAYKLFDDIGYSTEFPTLGVRFKEIHDVKGHYVQLSSIYNNGEVHESSGRVVIKYEEIFVGDGDYKVLERKKLELVNLFMLVLDGIPLKSADGTVTHIKKMTKKNAISCFVASIFDSARESVGETFKMGHEVWEENNPNTYYIPSNTYMLKTQALADKVVNDLGVIATKDGSLFTYVNGVYVKDDGEKKIRAYIDYILGNETREQARKEVIAYIASKFIVDVDELIGNSEVVNFRNGYYDLRDKTFKPHDHSFKSVFQFNADYVADGTASCPNITQFLIDILPDERYRNIMLDFLAYCLIPDTTLQKAMFMLGAGSNGKTRLLELFRKLIGESAYSAMSIHQIEKDRFAPIRIMTKLVNICGDMPSGKLNECQMFKNIVGGDTITGEAKFKDPIDFESKTRFLLAMNHCPVVNDSTDNGYFRRIILIRFTRNFEKEVDINGNPIKDAGIMKRLTTPEELSGFMHMLLGRLQVMHDRAIESGRGYTIDGLDSDEETRKRYNTNSFPERQFCDDVLEFDSTSYITLNEAYDAYKMWCRECGEVIRKERILKEAMKYNGFRTTNNKGGETDMNIVWEGVRIKLDYDPEAKKAAAVKKGIDIQAARLKAEDSRKKKMELAYWNEYWKTANPTLIAFEYASMMRAFYQKAKGDNYPTEVQLHEQHLALWNTNNPDEQHTEYLDWMSEYAKDPELYMQKLLEHRARCEEEKAHITAQALSLWNYLNPRSIKDTPDDDVWEIYRSKAQLIVQALDFWNRHHPDDVKHITDEKVWEYYIDTERV